MSTFTTVTKGYQWNHQGSKSMCSRPQGCHHAQSINITEFNALKTQSVSSCKKKKALTSQWLYGTTNQIILLHIKHWKSWPIIFPASHLIQALSQEEHSHVSKNRWAIMGSRLQYAVSRSKSCKQLFLFCFVFFFGWPGTYRQSIPPHPSCQSNRWLHHTCEPLARTASSHIGSQMESKLHWLLHSEKDKTEYARCIYIRLLFANTDVPKIAPHLILLPVVWLMWGVSFFVVVREG